MKRIEFHKDTLCANRLNMKPGFFSHSPCVSAGKKIAKQLKNRGQEGCDSGVVKLHMHIVCPATAVVFVVNIYLRIARIVALCHTSRC